MVSLYLDEILMYNLCVEIEIETYLNDKMLNKYQK